MGGRGATLRVKSSSVYTVKRLKFDTPLEEYKAFSTPGEGILQSEAGYDYSRHQEEVTIAQWLLKTFGGDIKLLSETPKEGKRADFLWGNELWELKSVSSVKAANSAVRKGLSQIEANPGGIILDYGSNSVKIDEVKAVINKRMAWYVKQSVDIMIVQAGQVRDILRYSKK